MVGEDGVDCDPDVFLVGEALDIEGGDQPVYQLLRGIVSIAGRLAGQVGQEGRILGRGAAGAEDPLAGKLLGEPYSACGRCISTVRGLSGVPVKDSRISGMTGAPGDVGATLHDTTDGKTAHLRLRLLIAD